MYLGHVYNLRDMGTSGYTRQPLSLHIVYKTTQGPTGRQETEEIKSPIERLYRNTLRGRWYQERH
jgi:hypothetical protein